MCVEGVREGARYSSISGGVKEGVWEALRVRASIREAVRYDNGFECVRKYEEDCVMG